MSDDRKPGSGAASDASRRSQNIDLSADAVQDLTPKREPAQPEQADSATPRVEAPAARKTEPRQGGSGSLAIGAGAVAGAIFGLLGSIVYQNVQKPPVTVADPRVAQVEAAIAAVEKKAVDAGEVEQRLAAAIKAADARAAAVEARAAAVEKNAQGLDQKAAALEQRTAAFDQKTAALEQRAAAAEQQAAAVVQPVDARLKAAEARFAAAQEATASLNKKVDLLAQIEPPKLDLKPIIGKVEELERAIGSTAARVTLGGDAAAGFDGRIKGVEAAVKGLDASDKALETTVKGVESRIAALAQPRPVETGGAILAVAGHVRRALEAGTPLGPLSAALGALGVTDAARQPLAVYAQAPAPRPAGLADFYADLAAKAPKPAAPPAPPKSDGILERVTSGLLSQVEVRKVGVSAAPDATGLAGAVRQRLLAGDLTGAVQLTGTLPADQQAAVKPFVDAANAYGAAFDALRKIEAEALAAVSRKG